LLDGLKVAGLTRTAPADGAFYIYADVGHLTGDSRALAARILNEAGVAVTPGLDFDKGRGHHTLRLSYARGTAEIEEGVARLTRFFAGL
jgi:aspartate/methionine/tyrosine aminotransferase